MGCLQSRTHCDRLLRRSDDQAPPAIKIRFLSFADREVDDAVRWFEEQEEGLSRLFLDELDRIVRLVRIYPLIATQVEPEIRRFLFAHFPYSLIYGIDQETIWS